MPEQDPKRDVLLAAGLGVLGEIPGLGGPVAALQAALQAASRARDEEWWAMTLARLASVEKTVDKVLNLAEPEFLAAAHRLLHAAQETADEEKRQRLADALAHAGSWSDLPSDYRDRMERLVMELSSREVLLIEVFADPKAWLQTRDPSAIAKYENQMMGSIGGFIDGHLAKDAGASSADVRASLEGIQRRGLVDVPINTMMTGSGVLQARATKLGTEFRGYLQAISSV